MTRQFSGLVRLGTTIVISAVLGACGGSAKSPVAPTGGTPAVAPAPPTGVVIGASIDGTIVGLAGGQAFGMRAQGAAVSVSVMGTNVSSPVDGSGHFALRGVPTGDARLQVTGTGVNAMLTLSGVTDHEQIHLTIQVNGSSASADDSNRETADNRVEAEGRIAAISGNTLTVAGQAITVPAGTPIHHGGTAVALSALSVGVRVHVHATRSAGVVTATDVEVQNEGVGGPPSTPTPGDDHGNDQNEAEVHGTVSARGGSCPSITFTVGLTSVTTNASTTFKDTTCSAIANGNTVEVKGTRQSNGTVLARSVEQSGDDSGDDDGNDNNKGEQELSGTLSGRGGSCPSITFSIGSTNVATNGSTSFKDTACSTLANGDRVEVKGTKQSSGTVLATRVQKKN